MLKLLLAANMISLALIGLAAYIAHLNLHGWGWCVFGAVLCAQGVKYKSS